MANKGCAGLGLVGRGVPVLAKARVCGCMRVPTPPRWAWRAYFEHREHTTRPHALQWCRRLSNLNTIDLQHWHAGACSSGVHSTCPALLATGAGPLVLPCSSPELLPSSL